MNVRVCAAVEAELGVLPGQVLGVGAVVAAVAAGRFLALERPDAVVLVGTAGAYAGGPAVGTVVAASELGLASTAAALGLGYVPCAPGILFAHPELLSRAELRVARVLTAIAITTDAALAEKHAAEWEVEHMEAYAVAWACAQAKIPFLAVLGIANRVGPGAHDEWVRNRAAAQLAAQNAVARLIVGATGGASPPVS